MQYVTNSNLKITSQAQNKVKEVIKKQLRNKTKHFGNAREMRQLFDIIKSNLNKRVVSLIEKTDNIDIFSTIQEEDVINTT